MTYIIPLQAYNVAGGLGDAIRVGMNATLPLRYNKTTQTMSIDMASSSVPGAVSAGDQVFLGPKTIISDDPGGQLKIATASDQASLGRLSMVDGDLQITSPSGFVSLGPDRLSTTLLGNVDTYINFSSQTVSAASWFSGFDVTVLGPLTFAIASGTMIVRQPPSASSGSSLSALTTPPFSSIVDQFPDYQITYVGIRYTLATETVSCVMSENNFSSDTYGANDSVWTIRLGQLRHDRDGNIDNWEPNPWPVAYSASYLLSIAEANLGIVSYTPSVVGYVNRQIAISNWLCLLPDGLGNNIEHIIPTHQTIDNMNYAYGEIVNLSLRFRISSPAVIANNLCISENYSAYNTAPILLSDDRLTATAICWDPYLQRYVQILSQATWTGTTDAAHRMWFLAYYRRAWVKYPAIMNWILVLWIVARANDTDLDNALIEVVCKTVRVAQ